MALIVILILFIVSIYSIKKHGFCGYAVFFFLCGSTTDSAGILYGIESYIPYFKSFIWVFTFLLFFISVLIILAKGRSSVFFNWYFIPFLLVFLWMVLGAVLKDESYAYISSSFLATGIPYFFLWIIGRSKPGRENVLFYMILAHALVSVLIIISKNDLALINGYTYLSRIGTDIPLDYIENSINSSLSIFNFDKYSIQKNAQFHNSNALGFFSSILISAGIAIRFGFIQSMKKVRFYKLIGITILGLGILLWFNSLTRGPIVLLLLLWIFIYTRKFKIIEKFELYFIFLLLIIGPVFLYSHVFINYLIPSIDNVSYSGRLIGYKFAFEAIIDSPFFGGSVHEYPAHLYTLKIMAYHGIFPGLFVTIPLIHIFSVNLKCFLNDIKRKMISNSTFSLMLVLILYGMFLTNGTVSYALYGIILAEACIRNGISLNSFKKTILN